METALSSNFFEEVIGLGFKSHFHYTSDSKSYDDSAEIRINFGETARTPHSLLLVNTCLNEDFQKFIG